MAPGPQVLLGSNIDRHAAEPLATRRPGGYVRHVVIPVVRVPEFVQTAEGRVRLFEAMHAPTSLPAQTQRADRTRDFFELAGVVRSRSRGLRAEVEVSDTANEQIIARQVTNADGTYSVRLPAGATYIAVVLASEYHVGTFFVKVPRSADEAVIISDIEGRIFDPGTLELARIRPEEKAGMTRPELETGTHAQFFSVNTPQTEFYPLPGMRTIDDLALLFPGIAPAPEALAEPGPSFGPTTGSAGRFSANGLRSRDNNFTVDGSDNNDEEIGIRRQGFVVPFAQTMESVKEFQIITALPDARFGRNIGAQINVLSSYGSADFHGDFYGFATARPLRARNFFDTDVTAFPEEYREIVPITTDGSLTGGPVLLLNPRLVRMGSDNPVAGENPHTRTQAGFLIGRAIVPEKAFFSAGFEEQHVNARRESHFATPTVEQRGLFGKGAEGVLIPGVEPYLSKPTTFMGDAFLSLLPFPNNPLGPYGPNTFTEVLPQDQQGRLFSFKVDNYFGADGKEHVLTARYNITDERSTLPETGGAVFSSLNPAIQTQNFAGFFTSFRTTFTNTARFSFGRTIARFDKERGSGLLAPSNSFLADDPFLLNAPLFVNASGGGLIEGFPLFLGPALLGGLTGDQLTVPVGQMVVAGFSPVGADVYRFPQARNDKTFQLADTLSLYRGNHELAAGFDVRRVRIDSRVERNVRPLVAFHGLRQVSEDAFPETFACLDELCTQPGNPLPAPSSDIFSAVSLASAAIPAGVFRTLAFDPDLGLDLERTQWDAFFQDTWKVSRGFRFTLGARLGYRQLPTERNNRFLRGFDIKALNRQAEDLLAEPGCNGSQPESLNCAEFVRSLQAAFPGDFKQTFGADTLSADFRAGFVWRPANGRSDFVLRGGWGSYSASFPAIVVNESRTAFPNFVQLNLARAINEDFEAPKRRGLINGVLREGSLFAVDTAGNPELDALKFAADRVADLGLSLVLNQPGRELRNPRSHHYALTLERVLPGGHVVALSYVGTLGRNLLQTTTPDQGVHRSRLRYLGLVPAGGVPRQVSSVGLLTALPNARDRGFIPNSFGGGAVARVVFDATARSSYNSLQLQLRRAYRQGLYFNSALTYSHAIDEVSDFFDMAGAFALPQNSLRPSERGSANFDIRLRSVTHFVWELPVLRDNNAFGGWSVTGICTLQGGQPFTVNSAIDSNMDGNLTDRLHTIAGLLVEPIPGNRRVKLGLQDGVNPESLIAPAGVDGAIGRNTFRAEGIYNLDLAVVKALRLFGEQGIEFRAEVFNFFNRAHFATPVRMLEFPGFGSSARTVAPARVVQFSLKYSF